MFGYRARIGYTVPMAFVEVFPFEFYRMVPAGVTLVIATTHPIQATAEGDGLDRARSTARDMVQAGVSVIVFGGASPSFSVGMKRLEEFTQSIEKELGVPTTTAVFAQRDALEEMKAKRVGVVTPFGNTGGGDRLEELGFEVVGVRGAGYQQTDFGRVPTDAPAQTARELVREHPDVDTLFFPAAHWTAASNVEALEAELGLNVVTSAQAIVWQGLRRSGINDAIQGYGRLLREH